MKWGRSILMAGAGMALVWFLDERAGATRRQRMLRVISEVTRQARMALGKGGADSSTPLSGLLGRRATSHLVAPPTPMRGPAGAGRPDNRDLAIPARPHEQALQPTPATTGPLPLTDETAGGHQVLAGGPMATTPTTREDETR
jgi:hypothetical protein